MHMEFGQHLFATVEQVASHAFNHLFRIFGALAVMAVILLLVERWAPLRKTPVRRPELLNDIAYCFIAAVAPYWLLLEPKAVLTWAFHGAPFRLISLTVSQLPLWARLGAAVVVNEIGIYWGHRMFHEIPFLWRFHAVHHSPEHMDFWVGTRLHPFDPALTTFCGMVPAFALGLASPASGAGRVTAFAVVALSVLGTFWHYCIHANVRLRLGFFEQVVTSPAFHHWHHTLGGRPSCNYANLLPGVDRIFGTLHLPDAWPAAYGVDEPVSSSMIRQLVDPLKPLFEPLLAPMVRVGLNRRSHTLAD